MLELGFLVGSCDCHWSVSLPLRRGFHAALVDLHARPHRRGDGDAAEILALGRGGFALTMLSSSAVALSIRFCDENDVFPTGACTMPVLSTRNSTLPALISLTACATFGVTVPVFGFGIRPRGPSTLPELADDAHHVGRRDDRIEVDPAAGDLLDELFAADDVGAGFLGFLLLVGDGDHQHALRLAQPVRQHDGAAHHLIGVLRIDAETNRQRDGLVELRELDLLNERQRLVQRVGRSSTCSRAAVYFLPCFLIEFSSVVCRALRALPPLSVDSCELRTPVQRACSAT